MKKILNISLVAVLAVTPLVAHADIASTGYVTKQIEALDSSTADTGVTSTGTGSFLTGVTIKDGKIFGVTKGAPAAYTLPTASTSTKGGVTVDGTTITAATDGKISVKSGVYATAAQGTKADSAVQTVSQTGSGVVKTVVQNGATVSVTAGALTASDIPTITSAKISDFSTAAKSANSDKQLTTNIVAGAYTGDSDAQVTADRASTNATLGQLTGEEKVVKYPSIRTAEVIAYNEAAKVGSSSNEKIAANKTLIEEMVGDSTERVSTNETYQNYGVAGNIGDAFEAVMGVVDQKQNADTAVKHTANTAVGSSKKPVYIDAQGNATAISGAVGGAKQPVYIASDGTITAGTQLKALAYKDKVVNADITDGAVTMAKTEMPGLYTATNATGSWSHNTLPTAAADGRYTLVLNKKGSTITYDWEFIDGESAY